MVELTELGTAIDARQRSASPATGNRWAPTYDAGFMDSYENVREAIGVMSAWAQGQGNDFVAQYLVKLVQDYGPEKRRT